MGGKGRDTPLKVWVPLRAAMEQAKGRDLGTKPLRGLRPIKKVAPPRLGNWTCTGQGGTPHQTEGSDQSTRGWGNARGHTGGP